MRTTAALPLVLGALAAGCGSQYEYVPASNATAQVAGRPAADVHIPPEVPHGDVRVATFGFADVRPSEGSEQTAEVRALHLRLIVANNSERPWLLDTREQRLSLAGRGESRPAYASADGGATPPQIVVPAGGKRTIDLFFPLPADMQHAKQLPAFDAIWTVQTDTRVVTERTPFERLKIQPQYYGYGYYDWDFWGPGFWYDPLYGDGAWGGVALPPAYTDRPVMVNRPVFVAPPAHGR